MILAFDIGNSSIKAAIFNDDRLARHFRYPAGSPADFDYEVTAADIAGVFAEIKADPAVSHELPTAIAVSSVVPALKSVLRQAAQENFDLQPWFFDHKAKLGIKILTENPDQVGVDRLAGALAAKTRFGAPVITVDLGTATTFNVVDYNGNFAGGVIAPGIATSASALFKKAAKLFPVDIARPERCLGKNTGESLQAGIFYGAIGQIDGILVRLIEEIGARELPIVATGGLVEIIAPYCKYIKHISKYLNLEGVKLAYERAG